MVCFSIAPSKTVFKSSLRRSAAGCQIRNLPTLRRTPRLQCPHPCSPTPPPRVSFICNFSQVTHDPAWFKNNLCLKSFPLLRTEPRGASSIFARSGQFEMDYIQNFDPCVETGSRKGMFSLKSCFVSLKIIGRYRTSPRHFNMSKPPVC